VTIKEDTRIHKTSDWLDSYCLTIPIVMPSICQSSGYFAGTDAVEIYILC
jgi:hypothetical protein